MIRKDSTCRRLNLLRARAWIRKHAPESVATLALSDMGFDLDRAINERAGLRIDKQTSGTYWLLKLVRQNNLRGLNGRGMTLVKYCAHTLASDPTRARIFRTIAKRYRAHN